MTTNTIFRHVKSVKINHTNMKQAMHGFLNYSAVSGLDPMDEKG